MSKGLFVTGTGTDVGKTYISGLLVKALWDAGVNAAYYKAAVSGNERVGGKLIPGDALYVKEKAGISQELASMVPYVYEQAVSPHLAARLEGNPVEQQKVYGGYQKLQGTYEYITMEGSGGIVCPLRYDTQTLWLEDIVMELSLPVLIVAAAGLGTINGVVLTVEYLRQRHIRPVGIVFNRWTGGVLEEDNRFMVEQRTGVPVVACVSEGDERLKMETKVLQSLYK